MARFAARLGGFAQWMACGLFMRRARRLRAQITVLAASCWFSLIICSWEASKIASCRLQLGATSPALLCSRFVWLYLKWLGSLLGWADLPNGWPAALTTRRARRSRAQGRLLWCLGYLLFEEDEVFFFEAAEEGL